MEATELKIKITVDSAKAKYQIREIRKELEALNRARNNKKWWQFWK